MQTEVTTQAGDEEHLLLKNHTYEVLDPDLCQCVAKPQQQSQAESQVENQEKNKGTELEGPQSDLLRTQQAESVLTQPEDITHDLTEQGAWYSSVTSTSTVRTPAEEVPEKAAAAAEEQKAELLTTANYFHLLLLNKSTGKSLDEDGWQYVLQHESRARQPQAEEHQATVKPETGGPQEGEKPRKVEQNAGDLGAEIQEAEAGEPELGVPQVETEEPRAEEAEAHPLVSNSQYPDMNGQVLSSRLNAEANQEYHGVTAGDAADQDHTEPVEEEVTREHEAAGDASAKATAELKVPAGGAMERQYSATAVGRVTLTARVAITEKTSPLEGVTGQQDEDSDAELLSEPEQISSTTTPPQQEEEGAPQWPEGDEWDAVELEDDRPEEAGPQEDTLTMNLTISGLRSAIKIYISPVEHHRSRPKQRGRI